MYHRFVIADGNPQLSNPGLISVATVLWSRNRLRAEDDARFNPVMLWFNHHLQAPKSNRLPDGWFWFKDEPRMVEKSQELAVLMASVGKPVAHFSADDPGTIVFEDKFQVAARHKRRTKHKLIKVYR